ncbi:SDR family oxidoreductase [Falsigemmobacter faecalis]|uniref:SDR family oxidoreductase n=1 Tax=Falsigemmobacter faecalis TaxID=2488730 RepID=A0A3P3DJK1_9RHOB|nr:SDR family oxidoreductase [Falsigemmobacter faecalis]RRH73876.1 SDR family oxidoreductase [Falsigemmobacter faecalis]
MRLLCLGTGYVAQHLARALPDAEIFGTTRSVEKHPQLQALGITPLSPEGLDFTGYSHILISAGPGPGGDPFLSHDRGALREARPDWVGYLSATSVYGDHQGAWVDEETPATPTGPRGAQRLRAEEAWAASGLPLHIFRLAGIYGPGRSAFDRLRAGDARRIVKPGQYFSRIHVEDIVQVLRASMQAPQPGLVINVADDDPAPPQDVITFAARLLGLEPPPEEDFDQAVLSAMARSFYDDNKRVTNARMKARLGVSLVHTDYREGLRALLAAGH